jgi:small subunit ribosomal protein S17
MFRRKKKEEQAAAPTTEPTPEVREETPAPEVVTSSVGQEVGQEEAAATVGEPVVADAQAPASADSATKPASGRSGNRVQKIGIVASDKMQKTVLVRVDRLVRHPKYRRYVRRTSKFMAHDDLGSTTGDRVRIVETRPLSARKRWRVVEIVQKAAK